MFLRFLLFALMGVGIIGFTGVAWMASHTTNDAVAAAPLVPATKIKVVTINRAVRAGTLLKSDDIGGRDIVADQLAPGYAEDTPEARRALIGSMVRASMVPGDVILPTNVARPRESGFLAAVGADYLVDIATDPSYASPTAWMNAAIYQADGIHPNVAGEIEIANFAAPILNAL